MRLEGPVSLGRGVVHSAWEQTVRDRMASEAFPFPRNSYMEVRVQEEANTRG